MIIIYNILITVLLLVFLPFLLIKAITNKRYRYHLLDRFFPKPINKNSYFLIHASSFGEIKTILSFIEDFEKSLKSEAVISVFTDTAHKHTNKRKTILMPIDLVFLHKRVLDSPPKLAIFFETEIWPSYIYTLKKMDSKVILINARMSQKSFSAYKRFGFLFKPAIKNFDLIIAKSKADAKRYRYFNENVIVCGNLKVCVFDKRQRKKSSKQEFLIETDKPIMTLASFHREEISVVLEIISNFLDKYFIVLAPRHLEDVVLFENYLKKNGINYTKRTEEKKSKTLLILDTIGELEKVYTFSNVSIVGGSFHESLKGHNPIEPVFYNNLTICGPYMESFKEEVDLLKKKGLIYQVKGKNLIEAINLAIKSGKPRHSEGFFQNLSYILNCYLIHTNNIYRKS